MTDFEGQVLECKLAFADLANRRGYSTALREINRRFDRSVVCAFEQQAESGISPSEHGQHTPDPSAVQAARKWRPLYDKTASR